MTSAERAEFVRRIRRQILASGHVVIESDAKYPPISADPLVEEKPYVTNAEIAFDVAGRRTVVAEGFEFDGASIPTIVQILKVLLPILLLHWTRASLARQFWTRLLRPMNTFYRNLYAACLHDWRYYHQDTEREIADAEYQIVLMHSGETYWVARGCRIALDWFGGKAWRDHAERIAREREEQRRNDHA